MEIVVGPASAADRIPLHAALAEMSVEDPSLELRTDPKSGLTILGGHSEWHLDHKLDLLLKTYAVGVKMGAPEIAYREGLGGAVEIDHSYARQSGDSGDFARVGILFEPGAPDSGFVFESRVGGFLVPSQFVPGVEAGLRLAKEEGLIAGFPVIDFKATLVNGGYHDIDSSVPAFELAAHGAFQKLRDRAAPRLLEPIMRIEVVTPSDYADGILADLGSRRGTILEMASHDAAHIIFALAPLANLFGYSSAVRHLSQGGATFAIRYDHYGPMPVADDDPPRPAAPALALRA